MKIDLIEADAPLTLQTRAALALNSTNTELDLRAMAIKNVTITQVIDKVSRQQCHSAAMELKTARTTIAKVSKDAREDATAFQKAIIAEEKRLIAIVEPEETRLIGLRDDFDAVQERIKREEEARERARVTAIHERIAEIRSFSSLASQCRTSVRIAELLAKLEAFDLDGFEEFSQEAATVHAATVSGVKFLLEEKSSEEIERANLKAEAEALAAQLAADRAEQAKAAAVLAADRAAFEKEKAEVAAAKAAAAQAIEDAKPKATPVDEYEQELQAFAAVVAPEPAPVVPAQPVVIDGPLVMSSALRAQFEKTYAYCDEVWNPSDVQILDALCQHFNKSERLVYERLARGFDLAALNAATFDDVPV
jgi:hypothetical protein